MKAGSGPKSLFAKLGHYFFIPKTMGESLGARDDLGVPAAFKNCGTVWVNLLTNHLEASVVLREYLVCLKRLDLFPPL